MMNKNEELCINKVIKEFQNNKGKASFYCFNQDLINNIISEVIINFRKKRPIDNILIAVDCYTTRQAIMNYMISKELTYNITYISENYINIKYQYDYTLIISVGINSNDKIIYRLFCDASFMICILTKNIMNNDFITNVRSFLPDINLGIEHIKKDNTKTPVEEIQYGIDMTTTDIEKYNKYTEFINACITMFGDIKTIDKCRTGDIENGISAAEYRDLLARQNGWSEQLDITIEYQANIDNVYNPNSLYEKAQQFYNITRNRRDLVTDNEAKLETILDICKENKDKKILIISKRGEFARIITKYLSINDINVGDYHDCIEDAVATDEYGNVICYKSGEHKGEPKILHSQAISSSNMKRFNNEYINVLSIKNSSSNKLKIDCDVVIFTTPFCDNIIDIKNRFKNINVITNPNKTYKLYCNGTIESNKIYKDVNPIIKVISNININYDEKSGDIIL